MKLENQIAVVTGGSRGIGAATALRLARDGATIAVVYRADRAAADSVVRQIREAGGRAEAFQADVSDENAARAMINAVVERYGHIDILVNAAGIVNLEPLGEITRENFEHQLRVNAWSVIATIQAALPYFPKTGGAIINVSSNLVLRPRPGLAVYSASKSAVETLTNGFAKELGLRNIRVNAVAPAVTRTDMTAGLPSDYRASETASTPLGRLAEPDDIADAIAFFASNDARWITGRTILTDGGRM